MVCIDAGKFRRLLFGLLLAVAMLAVGAAGAQQAAYVPPNCANFYNGATVQGTAPWYCSSINVGLSQYWEKWAPVALLAVYVSFSIASIIFGLGIFLRNERIRNFGIGEYYEALASLLIVALFLTISGVMFGLIPGTAAGPVNPYVTALNYISSSLQGLQDQLRALWQIVAVSGFYVSVKLVLCFAGGACTKIPEPYGYAIQYLEYFPAIVIIDAELDVLALLYAEFWIIMVFMYIAIPVFLVPGVVLRSLIPTRGLGGMMIAAAIGFYLVLPLLFSVAYYFTSSSAGQQVANTAALQQYGAGTGPVTNALSKNSPLVQTLNSIQVGMDSYWLSVLFYPALIMALTYAVIIQVAEFIGGMAQLSGRIRV